MLDGAPGVVIDYVALVDPATVEPVPDVPRRTGPAARRGTGGCRRRLIDNMAVSLAQPRRVTSGGTAATSLQRPMMIGKIHRATVTAGGPALRRLHHGRRRAARGRRPPPGPAGRHRRRHQRRPTDDVRHPRGARFRVRCASTARRRTSSTPGTPSSSSRTACSPTPRHATSCRTSCSSTRRTASSRCRGARPGPRRLRPRGERSRHRALPAVARHRRVSVAEVVPAGTASGGALPGADEGRGPRLATTLAAPEPGWVTEADVVVVGSGIAGLTAALELRTRVRPGAPRDEGRARLGLDRRGPRAGSQRRSTRRTPRLPISRTPSSPVADSATVLPSRCSSPRGRRGCASSSRSGRGSTRTLGGEMSLTREGGHHADRIAHAGGDATGAEISRALVAQLEAVRNDPGIEVIEHALVIDLLTSSGPVAATPGESERRAVCGVTLHVRRRREPGRRRCRPRPGRRPRDGRRGAGLRVVDQPAAGHG